MAISVASKTKTFTNGNANDATSVNSEFAALFNNDSTIATQLNLVTDSAFTFAGNKTFSGVITPAFAELTIASGAITPATNFVRVDTEAAASTDDLTTITQYANSQVVVLRLENASRVVTLKHGTDNIYMKDDQDYVFGGVDEFIAFFYDSTVPGWVEIFRSHNTALKPEGLITGPPPAYASASTITLPAGLKVLDSTGEYLMEVATDQTIDITASGANGLDTGSEANSTLYHVYVVGDSSGSNATKGVFSVTNEDNTGTITLPSGYDIKRQLPLAVVNNGSGDFLKFLVAQGWPHSPLVLFDESASTHAGGGTTAGATNVLAVGTSATYASVSCTSLVPAYGVGVLLQALATYANACYTGVRRDSTGMEIMMGGSAGVATQGMMTLTSSQTFEYIRKAGSGSIAIDVLGYVAELGR